MSNLRCTLVSLLLATAVGCATTGSTTTPIVSQKVPAERSIDRAALRAKLAERRAITMSHFLAYREARVYPINNLPGGGLRHVWLDDWGNLCAAATLISLDWGREPTINAGKANREIQLARIHTGPLADWILTSGLTHHEIVAIQVPGSEIFERPRNSEVDRLYGMYIDVERQLTGLRDESLDAATDALMRRPELARELLGGHVAGPGPFAVPVG
ncbi:MAG: hypothetical protein IPQ07_13860 [Myxococcales bacterium]|nr:hypothetical protein [Myxococcales bacterium]